MSERCEHNLDRTNDGPVGGVCGGIANYFEVDPISVRLLTVALTLLTCGLGVLVYLAFWLILPREPYVWEPVDVIPEKARKEEAERYENLSLGVAVALTFGLFALSVVTDIIVTRFIGGSFLTNYVAIFAIDVGIARFMIAGDKGYTFLSLVEGGTLFAIGMITLLALTGIIYLRVDEWFMQNWPLLLIFAGLMVVSRARESREITALALAVAALFFILGLLFYIDIGPALCYVDANLLSLASFFGSGAAHV